MKRIDSESNPKFKIFRSLLESRGIKKEGLFLIFGEKVIEEILLKNPRMIHSILGVQDQSAQVHALFQKLKGYSGEAFFLADSLFKELNIFGIPFPILVAYAPEIKPMSEQKGPAVLLPFGDPSNLGAAFRTALAFGLDVIVLKEAAHPLHPKTLRAMSGNIFELSIFAGPSIKELAEFGEQLVLVDQGGKNISDFIFPKNAKILIGEEGPGIPADLKENHSVVTIPISKEQESLNATVAMAIAAYHYRQQFKI
jgi:TrmH family RNA methyltransferase